MEQGYNEVIFRYPKDLYINVKLNKWDYMDRLGLLNEVAKQINIEYHVNVDLYKSALDDCTVRYGKDNPKFYEKLQAQYARNN